MDADERRVCADCGEAWQLYGPEGLCWLCLSGPVPGNSGDAGL
jgi:hypothetical protein